MGKIHRWEDLRRRYQTEEDIEESKRSAREELEKEKIDPREVLVSPADIEELPRNRFTIPPEVEDE